ncbi:uncharacterized protein A4U43_C01F5520 [Asparagus officinalis]|uniref:Phytocyanin domain-containing protein n=2 Tax=Asparagus officinalis TaxID=4686 RepID=A0A5P1FM14_ASPOF|nr:uncharacterized protein A4U43_C01F5520 [Asparagus officinalis]
MLSVASAFEFRVGGPEGWVKPTGKESETYNHWAGRNRFHIGDSLHFKYANDSVLVVDREGYVACDTSNPLLAFTDGNSTFWFDHYGYFYFISGEPDHCRSGQRLIVRVMVHPFVNLGPGYAPSPLPSGSGSGPDWNSGSGPSGESWSSGGFKVASFGSYVRVFLGVWFGLVVSMFV